MVARRRGKDVEWPKGKILEDYVSTPADDRSVYATDGKLPHYLFFATKKDKDSKNFDIYVAVRHLQGKAWTAPTPLNPISTPADELHPWLSNDGKKLYFSRKTKEGWRVFVSKRAKPTGPGGWEKPELIEELAAGFHHATLMPDGKKMYLQGPLEKGRWGLFVSTLGNDGWKKPLPVAELNHPDGKTGDRSPNLNRDGSVLYFSSDRPGGKGGLDIYAVRTNLLKK
jgi:Tol biopolymer transport system component